MGGGAAAAMLEGAGDGGGSGAAAVPRGDALIRALVAQRDAAAAGARDARLRLAQRDGEMAALRQRLEEAEQQQAAAAAAATAAVPRVKARSWRDYRPE